MNALWNPTAFGGMQGMPDYASGMGAGMNQGGSGVYGGNGPMDFKFGLNAPTLQMGMQGLSSLGNLWGAWQSNKLAKDQLNFTKMITRANLENQSKAYNTALEDRGRSRAVAEGQTSAEAAAYLDRNRLPTKV